MSENKKYYITTAIAYASRKPHFGNTYEIIMADAYARYKRQRGEDVFLCTGTDEHGQKIEEYAKAAGMTPKAYVDGVAGEIKEIWDLMGASYNRFIRTTDEDHVRVVSRIFDRFYKSGDIYLGHYEGWYCTPCEAFFTNTQVVDGKCPDCGRPVGQAREEAYFFRMSKYAPRLIVSARCSTISCAPPRGSRTSASPVPPSSGGSRSVSTRSTWCTSGSTP